MNRLLCLGVGAAALLLGCGGPELVGSRFVKSENVTQASSTVIEVSATESPELAGTRLELAAGAVTKDTRITLELGLFDVATSDVAGPVAIWGPAGTVFTSPQRMTLPFSLGAGQRIEQLNILVQEANGSTFRIPHGQLSIDESTRRVSFVVSGFTRFQPNTQPACTTDSECVSGEQCVSGACVPRVAQCVADADCAAGQRCSAGACVPNGFVDGGPNDGGPFICVADAECGLNERCVRGACEPNAFVDGGPGDGGVWCTADADCGLDERCSGFGMGSLGQCVPDGDGGTPDGGPGDGGVDGGVDCRSDFDCGAGEQCVGAGMGALGVCLPDGDGGTPDGGPGDGGHPLPNGDGGMCLVDTDCGVGQVCWSGTCMWRSPGTDAGVAQCRADADCSAGQLCLSNVCSAAPACSTMNPCPGGRACIAGFCSR